MRDELLFAPKISLQQCGSFFLNNAFDVEFS